MIKARNFYVGFAVAMISLVCLLILPNLTSAKNMKPLDEQINVIEELEDLEKEATKREDKELLDIITNFDNLKAPIEKDKLRLNYLLDNVSYLVENKLSSEKTYVKYLENVIKVCKKYQQFSSAGEPRYILLSYISELAIDKIEQAKTYDLTFKEHKKSE